MNQYSSPSLPGYHRNWRPLAVQDGPLGVEEIFGLPDTSVVRTVVPSKVSRSFQQPLTVCQAPTLALLPSLQHSFAALLAHFSSELCFATPVFSNVLKPSHVDDLPSSYANLWIADQNPAAQNFISCWLQNNHSLSEHRFVYAQLPIAFANHLCFAVGYEKTLTPYLAHPCFTPRILLADRYQQNSRLIPVEIAACSSVHQQFASLADFNSGLLLPWIATALRSGLVYSAQLQSNLDSETIRSNAFHHTNLEVLGQVTARLFQKIQLESALPVVSSPSVPRYL